MQCLGMEWNGMEWNVTSGTCAWISSVRRLKQPERSSSRGEDAVGDSQSQ